MEAHVEQADFPANRRRERRFRVLLPARIVFNSGYIVFDCTVRNISAGGAMLEVETPLGIPRRFDIVVGRRTSLRPCLVKWRSRRRMGVAFADIGIDRPKAA
jgi:hypothetical protein